jgi:hypothetical protein
MRAFVWLLAASGLLVVSGSRAQEKNSVPPSSDTTKCVVNHLDRAYGITFKALTTAGNSMPRSETEIKITLEFTKDVKDVRAMRRVFVPVANPSTRRDPQPLVFHLFDEQNVSLGQFAIADTEGDLTGVKGDAFRVILRCHTATFQKTKKVEARLSPPPG